MKPHELSENSGQVGFGLKAHDPTDSSFQSQFCLILTVIKVKDNSEKMQVKYSSELSRLGFPGGAVVESLPANAGDTGSSPGVGRSHVPRSSWAREPQLPSLRVWNLCSAAGEAAMVRGPHTAMKSGPCLPQLGKALTKKRRPNTAINK